jgi:hypothetical protein
MKADWDTGLTLIDENFGLETTTRMKADWDLCS